MTENLYSVIAVALTVVRDGDTGDRQSARGPLDGKRVPSRHAVYAAWPRRRRQPVDAYCAAAPTQGTDDPYTGRMNAADPKAHPQQRSGTAIPQTR